MDRYYYIIWYNYVGIRRNILKHILRIAENNNLLSLYIVRLKN